MEQGLVLFEDNQYTAAKKMFSIGKQFLIHKSNGDLAFFVHQKGFKLKEAITVYADEKKTQPLLKIQARGIMDISAVYDVTTEGGEHVGALKREGLKSIIRDEWTFLNSGDEVIGKIMEDSMAMAMLRRFLFNIVPQTFDGTIGEKPVAHFKQHFNPFTAKYDLDFSMDTENLLDRRLGIAAVVLLLAIEGKQK